MAVLRRLLLVCAALTVPAVSARTTTTAGAQTLTEAHAKAGFLYNCAMFVSWPPAVGTRDLVIGIIGDEVMSAVAKDMNGQKVDGRTLRVASARVGDDLSQYHILFVGESASSVTTVLDKVKGAPVLTVGDAVYFTAEGGAVRLFTDQGRLRFEINMTPVDRAGLKVSAKMLGLARIVR